MAEAALGKGLGRRRERKEERRGEKRRRQEEESRFLKLRPSVTLAQGLSSGGSRDGKESDLFI